MKLIRILKDMGELELDFIKLQKKEKEYYEEYPQQKGNLERLYLYYLERRNQLLDGLISGILHRKQVDRVKSVIERSKAYVVDMEKKIKEIS